HLEAAKPFRDPMGVPLVHGRFVLVQLLAQEVEHPQVVERMNVTGDVLRHRAYLRTAHRVRREQAWRRKALVQVFDDRERLTENDTTDLERRHEPLGIHAEIVRSTMLRLAQAPRDDLVIEPLEVERDAYAIRRGTAPEGVELHVPT